MVRISAQLCKRPFTREQIPRNKRATRGHGGNVLSESYGACTFYTYTRFEKQFIESLGRRVDRKNGQRSRRQQRAHLFQLYTGCTSSSVWLFFFHRGRKCALLAASPSLVLRCVKPRPSLSHSPHLKKKKMERQKSKALCGAAQARSRMVKLLPRSSRVNQAANLVKRANRLASRVVSRVSSVHRFRVTCARLSEQTA